jgi:hypothetical protein
MTSKLEFKFEGLLGINAINQVEKKMSDEEMDKKGKQIANFLQLKMKDGRYNTVWGTKTPRGLYLSMLRLMDEIEEIDD